MTDSEGKVVVRGLDDSYTYKFKEVKAPEGYSVNTDDSTATWDAIEVGLSGLPLRNVLWNCAAVPEGFAV